MYTQAQTQSLKAYESVSNATHSGREIEAAVLTKAAMKLKECQDGWDAPDRDNRLEEALKYNQRIWSIFQSELSREDHELPKKLRLTVARGSRAAQEIAARHSAAGGIYRSANFRNHGISGTRQAQYRHQY
ncbi:MAG: flagellar biosynthesis regulator FlaF [Desulfobacterales bacterium]